VECYIIKPNKTLNSNVQMCQELLILFLAKIKNFVWRIWRNTREKDVKTISDVKNLHFLHDLNMTVVWFKNHEMFLNFGVLNQFHHKATPEIFLVE
jgi:hypothetical protein